MKEKQWKELLNEGKHVVDILYERTYSKELLKKNNYRLGSILKKASELKQGRDYCIVDFGTNTWQPGLKLVAIQTNVYKFETDIPHDDYKTELTGDEVAEYLKDKAIAYCE
jgi:hypothetical protein